MVDEIIAPADAFRLLLNARLSVRYGRSFRFVDKIRSYRSIWFWHWRSRIPAFLHDRINEAERMLCKQVKEGNIRLQSRSHNPPIDIDPIDCALGELHVFNQTLTVRAQAATPGRIYEHVFCVGSDVVKSADGISKATVAGEPTDSVIRTVITAIYDEADADRMAARPNIGELPGAVQTRLKTMGYEVMPSGRKIKKIGGEKEFRKRRGRIGVRKSARPAST